MQKYKSRPRSFYATKSTMHNTSPSKIPTDSRTSDPFNNIVVSDRNSVCHLQI